MTAEINDMLWLVRLMKIMPTEQAQAQFLKDFVDSYAIMKASERGRIREIITDAILEIMIAMPRFENFTLDECEALYDALQLIIMENSDQQQFVQTEMALLRELDAYLLTDNPFFKIAGEP